MLQGAIFDMDGTITLTEPLHNKAYSTIFKKYGINFTLDEEIMKYAGSGSHNIFTKVFEDRGMQISPEEIEKCMHDKKSLYTKIVQEDEIPIVPGVAEFMEKLKEHEVKVIIATGNSDLDAVRFVLKKVGLDQYFHDMISVIEVPRAKPFPDVFLEAAKRIGVSQDECVIFEDAMNGVAAAKAAGIRCIALATTLKPQILLQAGASAAVENYTQITNEILYGTKK